MFFRQNYSDLINEPTTAPMTYQLTQEELNEEYICGINHLKIVLNINKNKEDSTMVEMIEKLEAYRAELEAQKAEALAKDIMPEVDAKVSEYREKCIAEANAEIDARVNKITSDIACVNVIIEREKASEVAEMQVDMNLQ